MGSRKKIRRGFVAFSGRFMLAIAASGVAVIVAGWSRAAAASEAQRQRPNLIFILVDDLRYDAVGCAGNALIETPTIDSLARRGTRFANALVTLSICSPSRAACLTGRYGSANGVLSVGGSSPVMRPGEVTFAEILRQAGYRTGYAGKWHLPEYTPDDCGFEKSVWFTSNGPHYDRKVIEEGRQVTASGFIEDYSARRAVGMIESWTAEGKPFLLHLATQVPHMTPNFDWEPRPETLAKYPADRVSVPVSWQDDLSGKPPYLKTARQRTQALRYGYDREENIRKHTTRYYAAITETDAALGTVLASVERLGLGDRTYFVLISDNGWMLGDHGFTSKVLAYEPSMRVPLVVAGPDVRHQVREELVGNIDIAPTLLEMAGLAVPASMHGRSLTPLLRGETVSWRDAFLYEAPVPCLGSWPHLAVRTADWKYIRTFAIDAPETCVFEELYDLAADPHEMHNLSDRPDRQETLKTLRAELDALRGRVAR